VVTGGALTLVGVAAAVPVQVDASVVAAAAVLPVDRAAPVDDEGTPTATTGRLPVTAVDQDPATGRLDTAKLVKAVQLAEREATGAGAAGEPPISVIGGVAVPGGVAGPGSKPDADADPKADPDGARKAAPQAGLKVGGSSNCDLDTSQLGKVKPYVRTAAFYLGCRFGEPTVLGVAGRAGSSDHPSGKALDFMVDKTTGNALAACTLRNQEALGVTYVIWRQRINFGEGWQPMEDRGSPTANHMDHVHVSFGSSAGGRPSAC
jgi:hypothetical protein